MAVAAERAVLRAMNGDAEEVGIGLVAQRESVRFDALGRRRAEHGIDVVRNPLELDIGDGESSDVAAGAGERHPGSRRGLTDLMHHLRLAVPAQRRPVQEGAAEADAAVRLEETVAVGNGNSHAVAIDAGLGGENIGRGVGNQRRVMIAADRAVALNEVEQVRHLFEIGRNVRIVAPQMHVVENDMNNAFDLTAWRIQLTGRGRGLRNGTEEHNAKRQWNRRAKNSLQSFHRPLPDVGPNESSRSLKNAACLPTSAEYSGDCCGRLTRTRRLRSATQSLNYFS